MFTLNHILPCKCLKKWHQMLLSLIFQCISTPNDLTPSQWPSPLTLSKLMTFFVAKTEEWRTCSSGGGETEGCREKEERGRKRESSFPKTGTTKETNTAATGVWFSLSVNVNLLHCAFIHISCIYVCFSIDTNFCRETLDGTGW